MNSPLEEEDLTERLKLYCEYDDVIQQVEQAHRQFENDFDDVSNYLTAQRADEIRDRFGVEGSWWKIRSDDSPKWQGLLLEYWTGPVWLGQYNRTVLPDPIHYRAPGKLGTLVRVAAAAAAQSPQSDLRR